MKLTAITRGVSPSLSRCELTHLRRETIDLQRALEQHEKYRDALRAVGCDVVEIPADATLPDCVFIEDTAVVLDEVAVVTRPGAESRRRETDAVADVIARLRPVVRIEPPATLDGGDVLVLGDTIYAGLSARTSHDALEQLEALTGREVVGVRLDGCLHLKSAVTRVSDHALVINRQWVDSTAFDGWDLIDVDPDEPFAGNALLIGDAVIYPSACPKTLKRLEERGVRVVPVDVSELAKAEGGVTCCSLVIGSRPPLH